MWDAIWLTKKRAVIGCLFTTFVLSSILFYAVDWYWFYDTRGRDKGLEAEIYQKSIKQILLLDVAEEKTDPKIQEDIGGYISQMSPSLEVSKIKGTDVIWKVSNHRKVDSSRTMINRDFEIRAGDSSFLISFKYGNRPPFFSALMRAWTWSVLDYLENPHAYFKYNLYNRSTPLYSALAVIAMLSVPLFIRIYKDKQGYRSLKVYLRELEVRKDEAVVALADVQWAASKRIIEKDGKLLEISKELAVARSQADETSEVSNELIALMEAEMATVKVERQALITEREELQKAKEAIETQYAVLNTELISTKSAMENLQRLSAMQLQIENSITGEVANQTKLAKDSRTYNRLKAHLKKWIQQNGEAEISVSMHGTKKVVTDALDKVDMGFINEFFVHVRNERYSPAERRTIKVLPTSTENAFSGAINVYLDHDSGCALSFAYKARNKAPVNNIGFILAVLLRAVCKDFEDYTIKGLS